jgi:hypothetical protein
MKGNEMILDSLAIYKPNELIFASKFYREHLSGKVKEAAYYKALERLCKSQELMNIAKGVYHLPKKSKYGIVPPSEKEIISAFTKNGTGTVVGYSLYNALNLTTQVAKSVDVMSSALEGFTKTIRNITVHQVQIDYSESIQNMIHALEVLQNYYTIQDINHSAFITFTKKLADAYNEKAFKEVISTINYKKSTIAFLQEILNFYGRENNLNIYLSALSEYKHPRMEELYETTQI